MKIALNLLGIAIYFLMRYINRADQTTRLSITYWIRDNWPELLVITMFDLGLMIMFLGGGLTIDLNKYLPLLPEGIAFAGDMALCFLIGLVLSSAIYEMFKSKIKTKK